METTGQVHATVQRAFVFPVVVFACWRLAQLALTAAFGGGAGDTAFMWDGGAYARIVDNGYHNRGGADEAINRFFPAISWLAKGVSVVTPSARFAEILVANLIALGAFVTVFGVARAWKDDTVAKRSVLLLAVFPSSLFLWAFYSEGLFITASAGAYWAHARRRPAVAAVLLAVAAATRPPGILAAIVLAVAVVVAARRLTKVALLYVGAGAVGLGAVMLQMRIQAGDALAFVSAQADFGNRRFAFPWVSIREGLGALKDSDPRTAKVVDLLLVGIVVLCVVYSARARRSPWPLEAWLLAAGIAGVTLCMPFLSGFNRMVLAAWPMFAIGGELVGRAPRWARIACYSISAVLAVYMTKYWVHGDAIA